MTDVKQLITEHLNIWLTAETEKKSGRGRSSGANDTIYGVQKLRELILELAMHGKLVINKAPDQISLLKDQINLLNESKKNKNIFLNSNLLPKHWVRVYLSAIAEHNTGKTLDKNRNKGVSRPYITTSNLYWGRFELSDLKEFLIEDDELERCQAKKDDLLVIEGGDAGRSAIWELDEPICFQNHIHRVRPCSLVSSKYLYRYFEYFYMSGLIEDFRQGVGIKSLSGKKLATIPINLPPLEEQQRIVGKVDELMQLCDQLEQQQTLSSDAHATLVDTLLKALTESSDADAFQGNWQRIVANFDLLFTTEYSIEQLKQTILQLAVMGKLVKQDPNDEPASELLKKIADEKAKLIKEGKIKKFKPLPEIAEDEKPFELPSGWEWEKLGNISLINSGNAFSSQDFTEEDGLHRVIKITNIGVGEFIESSDYLNIELNKKIEAFQVFQDDLLLALTRPYISTGLKICKCPQSYDKSLLNQRVSMIRPFEIDMNEYIYLFMRSDFVLNLYKKRFSDSGLQPNLKMEDVTNLVIPLPPLIEQKYIIEKVSQLFSIIEQLQVLQSKLQKTKLHLADALVANAVEGG